MAKNRARINFFGGLPANNSKVSLDTNIIHYKELAISGAHGSLPRHHGQAVELIRSGVINVKPFITNHYPLEEIESAFEAATARQCMRVVVEPWGEQK